MKVSMEWLREYAVLDAPLDTLVEGLIETGTEVERVQRGPAGVVVARVLGLEPVPESTRGVRFADIDAGGELPVRVLTGAANLAPGDLVPYAPPGTVLVGWDEPLGVRAMFGGKYQSPGMLCSAVELGVGEDATGILHLDHGQPGQPLSEAVTTDTVLEVEVTTNRPDCLCHVGIAREMAAAIAETVREPNTSIPEGLLSAASMANRATVDVEDAAGCPRFAVRIIENVAIGPSPEWLQRRLRSIGLRPISNVVDVTNYVAHELGQPLHGFDLDRFIEAQGDGSRVARVVVRRGRDEVIACLDGVDRRAGPDDVVVCAGDIAVSFAGVIGGAGTAVGESTRNVMIEGATWDGSTVRATSTRHQVRTDASTLNEKGLSDTLPPLAMNRAAALIAELGGGHVLQDTVDVRARPLPPIPPIQVSGATISRLLGYHVDTTEAATVLARLGFGVEQQGDQLTVTVPHFRRDVLIVEDVVEEVGRSLGYDRVPSTLPGRRSTAIFAAAEAPPEDRVQDVLIGAGYDEAITWSFVSPALARSLEGVGEGRTPIPLRNPLSEEWSVLRISLLPGIVQATAGNVRRGVDDVRLFELGRAFWEGERRGVVAGSTGDRVDEAFTPLPAEPLLLTAAATASNATEAEARLRELQAVVARAAHELGGGLVATAPGAVAGLRKGRSGRLLCDGRDIGVVGELDAAALTRFDMRGRVVVMEIEVDALVMPERLATRRYLTPPRHPAVVQDLAVTVPAGALAGDALEAIHEAGGALLDSVILYDQYQGASVRPERKGWTFRLTYRAADRTLTGEEAQQVQDTIAEALRSCCGAEVRR